MGLDLSKALLLAIGWTVLGCTPPSGEVEPAPSSRQRSVLRVLPLGDSITAGLMGTHAGYRGYLNDHLVAAGVPFRFVGSVTDNPGSLPPGQTCHEGHSGFLIDQILQGCQPVSEGGGGWLEVKPNVVLLMIGTNNVFWSPNTRDQNADDLAALLDLLASQCPTAWVFVSPIPPLPTKGEGPVHDFNDDLRSAVSRRSQTGQRLRLVDCVTGFPTPYDTSLADNVHPTDLGYAWIANRWTSALVSLWETG